MKRVSDQENANARGFAQCSPKIWEKFQANVNGLRRDHEAYVASLPKDEQGVIEAALSHLAPDFDSLPRNFERAQHLAQALEIVLRQGEAVKTEGAALDAAVWIADQVAQDLRDVRLALDACFDVLSNAKVPENMRFRA